MKRNLFFVLLMSSFIFVGCNKKKDTDKKNDKAKVTKKTTKKPAKKTTKKPTKKPAKPVVKTTPATFQTLKLIKLQEIGSPMFAMCMNLKNIYNSPVAKGLGIDKKIKANFSKSKDFNIDKFQKCMGKKITNPIELADKVSVVVSDKQMAVVLNTNVDAPKFLACVKDSTKKKVEEITVNKIKGIKLTDKEVVDVFALESNKILMISDKLLKKVKLGEGQLGKGNVSSLFAGLNGCIKYVGSLPKSMLSEKKLPLPKMDKFDYAGGINLKNGLNFNLQVNTGNPKAAQSIMSMINLYKNSPQLKAQFAMYGLDAKTIDKLKINQQKGSILASLNLDMATIKLLSDKIKAKTQNIPTKQVAPKKAPKAKQVAPKKAKK